MGRVQMRVPFHIYCFAAIALSSLIAGEILSELSSARYRLDIRGENRLDDRLQNIDDSDKRSLIRENYRTRFARLENYNLNRQIKLKPTDDDNISNLRSRIRQNGREVNNDRRREGRYMKNSGRTRDQLEVTRTTRTTGILNRQQRRSILDEKREANRELVREIREVYERNLNRLASRTRLSDSRMTERFQCNTRRIDKADAERSVWDTNGKRLARERRSIPSSEVTRKSRERRNDNVHFRIVDNLSREVRDARNTERRSSESLDIRNKERLVRESRDSRSMERLVRESRDSRNMERLVRESRDTKNMKRTARESRDARSMERLNREFRDARSMEAENAQRSANRVSREERSVEKASRDIRHTERLSREIRDGRSTNRLSRQPRITEISRERLSRESRVNRLSQDIHERRTDRLTHEVRRVSLDREARVEHESREKVSTTRNIARRILLHSEKRISNENRRILGNREREHRIANTERNANDLRRTRENIRTEIRQIRNIKKIDIRTSSSEARHSRLSRQAFVNLNHKNTRNEEEEKSQVLNSCVTKDIHIPLIDENKFGAESDISETVGKEIQVNIKKNSTSSSHYHFDSYNKTTRVWPEGKPQQLSKWFLSEMEFPKNERIQLTTTWIIGDFSEMTPTVKQSTNYFNEPWTDAFDLNLKHETICSSLPSTILTGVLGLYLLSSHQKKNVD